MSDFTTDLPNAIDNVVQQVQYSTAKIEISNFAVANGQLNAEVTVSNYTGHRFPSGVGFRRAFIEFKALQKDGLAGLTIPDQFLKATWPVGGAFTDPVYLAGQGQSEVAYQIPLPSGANANNVTVEVTLYYQATPPYFLADRYQTQTLATARLRYLVDAMGTLEKTDFASWKILVAQHASNFFCGAGW